MSVASIANCRHPFVWGVKFNVCINECKFHLYAKILSSYRNKDAMLSVKISYTPIEGEVLLIS